MSLPGESVKAVCFPGIRECHAQARHQRRVENDGGTLVPRGQVYRGDGPDALAIQNDVLGTHAVPGGKSEGARRERRAEDRADKTAETHKTPTATGLQRRDLTCSLQLRVNVNFTHTHVRGLSQEEGMGFCLPRHFVKIMNTTCLGLGSNEINAS